MLLGGVRRMMGRVCSCSGVRAVRVASHECAPYILTLILVS